FLVADWWWKRFEPLLGPVRNWAKRRAAAWMRERVDDSDGLCAIFPPLIYTVIVLRCLGVAGDDPAMPWALKQFHDLKIEENGTLRLQPCVSPVWDTALTTIALIDAGLDGRAHTIRRAVRWLLEKEVRRSGDWSRRLPSLEPAGWFFEYRNGF